MKISAVTSLRPPVRINTGVNIVVSKGEDVSLIESSPIYPDKCARENISVIPCNLVNFKGISSKVATSLKKLAKYGMVDMYTGKELIEPRYLQRMQCLKTFDLPLKELIPIMKKKEKIFMKSDLALLDILNSVSKKKPDIKLDEALNIVKKEHEKKLLRVQQPVFEELIQTACDLPVQTYKEFIEFMKITNKRISREPVILPFSEKALIYKLTRAKEQIVSENNPKKIKAINNLIKSARLIFEVNNNSNMNLRNKKRLNREKKLENQMKPEVLKRNSIKIKCLRDIFESSAICNNKEIKHIFSSTSAQIHGFPLQAPFKRKEFVHDLKNILRNVNNRELVHKMMMIAHQLPTSKDCVSAFIVKYANETPEKIGFSLYKDYVCSIDHIHAKNNGGKNKIENYGLCSVYINAKKTNIPFDIWCRMHPETYANCQKYVDRLIELYNKGIFAKVGLDKSYIQKFAQTVQQLSPSEKPMVLDLSKFK